MSDDALYVATKLADAFLGRFNMGAFEQVKFGNACKRVFANPDTRLDAFRMMTQLASASPELAECMSVAVDHQDG